MPGGTLESEIFGSDDEDDEEAEDDEEYAQGQMSDDEDWYEPPSEEVADDTPELHTQDQDQDSQEPEVAVVVDGHTNADQIEYTAPKAPFLGTILERPVERLPSCQSERHFSAARSKAYWVCMVRRN